MKTTHRVPHTVNLDGAENPTACDRVDSRQPRRAPAARLVVRTSVRAGLQDLWGEGWPK